MRTALLAALFLGLLLFGCSAQGQQTQSQANGQSQGTQPVDALVVASQVKEFTVTAKNWDFTPATITVNKGDRVRLKITSADVPHSFTLPDFKIDQKLEPGIVATVEFTADRAGEFGFRCMVFCGSGHRGMKGTLVVKG